MAYSGPSQFRYILEVGLCESISIVQKLIMSVLWPLPFQRLELN